MKSTLLFILGFTVLGILGTYTIEIVRINTAKSIGYYGSYNEGVFRTEFWKEDLDNKFNTLSDNYKSTDTELIKTTKRLELLKTVTKDRAKIEGTALLFTILLSILGMVLFLTQRRKEKLSPLYWLGLFMSFLFMRYVLTSLETFILPGGMWCVEADLLKYYNLPLATSVIAFQIISLFIIIWLIYKVSNKYRKQFIIAGIIGLFFSGILWINYASFFLP